MKKCKKCGKKSNLLKTGYCELCNERFCDELANRTLIRDKAWE